MSEYPSANVRLMQKWGTWISGRIDKSTGSICDPYLRNPLRFQYHYPSILLGKACELEDCFPDASSKKIWEYFSSIPWEEQEVALEFNSFLLSLVHYRLDRTGSPLADQLKDYLLQFPLPSLASLEARNNNFTFMMRFVLAYVRKHFSIARDTSLEAYTDTCLEKYCLRDGFIIDTSASDREGYPSLVYHTKIAATLLCNGIINHCKKDFLIGKKAIDVLLKLTRINYLLAYGRSQMSIFGYANLYLSLQILEYYYPESKYSCEVKAVQGLLKRLQFANGEVALNLARDNKSRPGFDRYMYSIVYNSYAWAIISFADWLIESGSLAAKNSFCCNQEIDPGKEISEDQLSLVSERYTYYPDSGLLALWWERYHLVLNTKRFHCCRKLWADPRYQCLTPQVLVIQNKAVVPAIPFVLGGHVGLAYRKTWREKIGKYISEFRLLVRQLPFNNFLDNAGFLPFLCVGKSVKICAGTQKTLKVMENDKGKSLTIESELLLDACVYKGFLRRIFISKDNGREYSLGKQSCIKAEVTFDEESINFTYRVHIMKNNLRQLKLVHFNIRNSASVTYCRRDDNRSIVLDDSIIIQHSEDLDSWNEYTVPGTMGRVRYFQCAQNVAGDCTVNLMTKWIFK